MSSHPFNSLRHTASRLLGAVWLLCAALHVTPATAEVYSQQTLRKLVAEVQPQLPIRQDDITTVSSIRALEGRIVEFIWTFSAAESWAFLNKTSKEPLDAFRAGLVKKYGSEGAAMGKVFEAGRRVKIQGDCKDATVGPMIRDGVDLRYLYFVDGRQVYTLTIGKADCAGI